MEIRGVAELETTAVGSQAAVRASRGAAAIVESYDMCDCGVAERMHWLTLEQICKGSMHSGAGGPASVGRGMCLDC